MGSSVGQPQIIDPDILMAVSGNKEGIEFISDLISNLHDSDSRLIEVRLTDYSNHKIGFNPTHKKDLLVSLKRINKITQKLLEEMINHETD